MPRPPRIDIPGALYHVIARGNQRQTLFRDTADYSRYEALLARYQQRHAYTLHAYVLMPNHLHLLLSPARVSLAKTMQGLQQSYTGYFNRRYRMVGHCFQGRYKAILCEADSYLLELVRYLHLNPVRAGLAARPEEYGWSSHRRYLSGHDGDGVAVEAILERFSPIRRRAVTAYRNFVEEGLPTGHRDDLYTLFDQQLLGGERFAESMESQARHAPIKPPIEVSMDVITGAVAKVFAVSQSQMRSGGRSRPAAAARAVAAYLSREEAALRLRTVAQYFGRTEATLSLALLRLETTLASDPHLAARIDHLRRIIRRSANRKRNKQIIKA
jgi:putative transposase